MSKLTIIKQQENSLDLDVNIICHQVNCLGIMGGGITLQIKNRWPLVFEQYKEYCNNHINNPAAMMGKSFMSMADGIKEFSNAVYGLMGSCWKDCVTYTDDAPELDQEDVAQVLEEVTKVLEEQDKDITDDIEKE